MSRPPLDFYLEFASTYSYPAAMRIGALADAAGVAVRWRPFLLGPIFKAQGWDNSPFNIYPAKGRYMWRDLERVCGRLGLPFRRPDPFPQPSLLAARIAHAGLDAGWGEAFCRAVYAAEFGERPADRRRRRPARPVAKPRRSCRTRAGARPLRRDQGAATRRDRRSRATRCVRRAHFHLRRRRALLGPRPHGRSARLGGAAFVVIASAQREAISIRRRMHSWLAIASSLRSSQ